MTPTMSESSKIRELKERAIYKLTLRYGRPFVVFLNTPRLAGAIGSRPEDGNKQIPASVQQLTRVIRSEGVSLAAITRYAKLADSMQSMRMDSDELKRELLRAGPAGSGSGSGSGFLSSVYNTVTGRSPTDSGNPVETLETVKAQVRQLQNKLRACKTADNRRELQQAMQDLQRCNETVARLSQQIQDLNKRLREEEAEKARLMTQLSTESQAAERTRQAAAAAERKRQADQLAAERLAAGRLDTIRLEAGRRSADRRGRSGRTPQGPPQGPRTVDDGEETKKDECGALPTGFVSAPTVEKGVTTKEILEFAQATGFDKNKILVYSNRRDGVLSGFAFYCPILGVKIDGRNSTVDIDKKGQKVTLKTGRDANDFVIMSDFYVDKESFAAFLASERGTARAAPAAPATPPEPTRTPVDRFAGIKGTDDLSDSASDSDEEDEDMDIPTNYYFPEADLPKIKELVRLSDVDREMSRDDKLEKLYNYEKAGNQVWVLSSANFYKTVGGLKFPERTSKNKFPKNEKKPILADVNDTYTGTGTVPVKLMLRDGAEIEETYRKIVVIAAKWQQTPTAYQQSAAPASAPANQRSTRSATRATPSSSTPAATTLAVRRSTPSSSDGWEDLPAMTDHRDNLKVGDTIRKSGGGKEYVLTKVIKSGVQAKDLKGANKKVGTTKRLNKKEKWQKKRGFMDRIEDFEGVDGVVPALPSIRIPERHEM